MPYAGTHRADDRSSRRQQHILVRIPHVALDAEISHSKVLVDHQNRAPFDQFIGSGRGDDELSGNLGQRQLAGRIKMALSAEGNRP